MRRLVLVTMLLLGGGGAAAQESGSGRSYFGAPFVKYTSLRDQGALLFGGRGGFNLTRSLVLGGGACGTVSEVDAPHDAVPDAPGPLDLKVEVFGIDVEYAPSPTAPTFATLGVFLGGGAAHYMRDGTSEQHGETDFMLVLEPVAGIEQRAASWLHLHASVSYRIVRGVEQAGLAHDDIAGAAAALAIKIGRF